MSYGRTLNKTVTTKINFDNLHNKKVANNQLRQSKEFVEPRTEIPIPIKKS